jgi:hypothetical protein
MATHVYTQTLVPEMPAPDGNRSCEVRFEFPVAHFYSGPNPLPQAVLAAIDISLRPTAGAEGGQHHQSVVFPL